VQGGGTGRWRIGPVDDDKVRRPCPTSNGERAGARPKDGVHGDDDDPAHLCAVDGSCGGSGLETDIKLLRPKENYFVCS
jgi:hypothetical protein